MSHRTVTFTANIARRFPDPNFHKDHGIERHILFVPVGQVPPGLPLDPNARVPNIRRRIYQDIEKSLLNQDVTSGTFHLKHKGITMIARSVDRQDDKTYIVGLNDGDGIVDGGHTYELITNPREEGLPDDQFVKFEILTNIPDKWVVDIAGGLNTSMQVQPMSLDHLEGLFDWIKNDLRSEPYFDEIAWRENEKGEFDARDLVAIMTCFNIKHFPNTNDAQPVMAYEKKAQALKLYEDDPDSYKNLRPILKDILVLHDTIRRDSKKFWNEGGGKFGNFAFVEARKRGTYNFPFTGKEADSRLMNGALYPMLAAFRWMVEEDGKGAFKWRGGFKNVLKRWESSATELMKMTATANTELGRNPNAIGKSRNHWANLHARVAMRDLMARSGATA